MKKLIAGVFLALALISPAYADSTDDRVVALTNAERAKAGLPPLTLSAELSSSARGYSNAMAAGGFFSHDGPDGSTLVTRDEAAGYRGWTFVGENIAAGQTSPEQVVREWMNSPHHRENILSPNAREIGVGHAYRAGSPYGNYWTQEFGARPGAALAAQNVAPSAANANGCAFQLGFRTLHDAIPGVVGGCRENEQHNPANGDGLQHTSGGLLVWRKADNFTAFTDGYRSWVNGPYGVQVRLNTERFPWEGAGV